LRRRGDWPDSEQVAVFSPSPAGRGQGWGLAAVPPSQPSRKGGRSNDCLLGTAHIKAGELIPGRLLSPIEIQQILETES
jgi:tRNA pseudouridine55 synthase